MCQSCKQFWDELGAWLTRPLYSDVDPIDIFLTAIIVGIAVFILLEINSILKAKVI